MVLSAIDMQYIPAIVKIIFYVFLSICLLLSILMVIKPQIILRMDLWYFKWTFKLIGYDIELKPISPNRPQKIARVWGILMCLAFLAMLIFLRSIKYY
jgi:hypothetical protein